MKENKQIIKEAGDLLVHFNVLNINSVNHKPHPFCITEKHIERYTSISGESIRELEKKTGKSSCGMYVSSDGNQYANHSQPGWSKCDKFYDEHTSNKVMFLQLKENISDAQAKEDLLKLENLMTENNIDGFTFVETPEKYRINNKEEEHGGTGENT